MRPDRSAEYAARIKATVVAAGGTFTRGRRALIAEAGLTSHTGNVGLKTWLRTDQGTDGVSYNRQRGPQVAHYGKTFDETIIARKKLRDDVSAYRKELDAYMTARAELESISNPGQELDRFQRIIAEQADREYVLARLERAITRASTRAGTPGRYDAVFAIAPEDARA